MSNYDLKSKLNEVQSELNRVESINRELKSELSTVEYGVSRAHRTLEDYNSAIRSALDNCTSSMEHSHQRVVDSIAIQGEIEVIYARFKQVELANKKIRAANNKKYYDFAPYRTVRKITQGLMDNLDLDMVSDTALTKSVEKGQLTSPDHYLTCALLAVMAWKNHDKELAERALSRAIALDRKHTALFFLIFNLRVGRQEAAMKWFDQFTSCDRTGSDISAFRMLFTISDGETKDEIDPSVRMTIKKYLVSVIEQNAADHDFAVEDACVDIVSQFSRFAIDTAFEYPTLKRHCPGAGTMETILEQAMVNESLLSFVLQTLNPSKGTPNALLTGFIDELIALPCQAEVEVYDEIAYNETIIRYGGDVEAAKEAFAKEQTKKRSRLNLIAEMITWIWDRSTPDVTPQMRKSMFLCLKDLHKLAFEAHVSAYRDLRTNTYTVTIEDYRADLDLTKEQAAKDSYSAFIRAKIKAEKDKLSNVLGYVAFGIGALAIVGGILLHPALFILTALGAAFGAYTLYSTGAKRKALDAECERKTAAGHEIIARLCSEFTAYQTQVDAYDAYYARIEDEMDRS